MKRAGWAVAAIGLLTCGWCGGWISSQWGERPAVAQIRAAETSTPSGEKDVPLTRQQLYDALERESTALERQSRVVGQVAAILRTAVVHIEAEKIDRNVRRFGVIEEAGSGVIISLGNRTTERYILTNSHVIRDAELAKIRIKLWNGRVLEPIKTWEDPSSDVAVIQVPATGLETARMGDSDKVAIGDFVLAVGSPFGLSQSVTFGIISAKGRRDLELGDNQVKYQDFMQTDAAINPGNSGGPLVNLRGEVIGINTAIASNSGGNEGIGFSIPINMVMTIANHLIEHGTVLRAFLGVTLDPKFGPAQASALGLVSPRGARVVSVRESTPAALSDVRAGDVILEFDSTEIEDDAHLINVVSLANVGRTVPLVIWRDRKRIELKVQLSDRTSLDSSNVPRISEPATPRDPRSPFDQNRVAPR